MKQSENCKTLFAAVLKAQGEFKTLPKRQRGLWLQVY